MKNTDEKNWEDHWKETLAEHESTPATEDWSGMKHQLETPITEPAQALVDPEVPRLSKSFIGRAIKFWPQSLLAFLVVVSLGFGLGQCRADDITNGINLFSKEADIPVNFSQPADTLTDYHRLVLPPARDESGQEYFVNTYLALDENGKPTGKFEYDTTFLNDGPREETSHSNSPGPATPVYRFDTIYELDDLGNLTDKIYSIDSVIIKDSARPAGLH